MSINGYRGLRQQDDTEVEDIVSSPVDDNGVPSSFSNPMHRAASALLVLALLLVIASKVQERATNSQAAVESADLVRGVVQRWNDVTSAHDVWVPVRGRGQVTIAEGSQLSVALGDLRTCERACDENADCESFVRCADGQCYLKDLVLSGTEPTKANPFCTTYFHTTARNAYRPMSPALLKPSKATLHTFYMYRAQGESGYAPENVNMASLGGVLWYLHSEVACHCPRRFSITRILRYKVQYRATAPLLDAGMNFGVRYAFDSGKCTGPYDCRRDTWDKYGYVVGCNDLSKHKFPFPDWRVRYPNAVWYSIPGRCPSKRYAYADTTCDAKQPGGICQGTPTGAGNCTFSYEEAGYVSLDDVVGIDSQGDPLHRSWCRRGCREYMYETNTGRCTHWWDNKEDVQKNQRRIDQVDAAFAKKYPDMPSDKELAAPPCDFDRGRFYGFARRLSTSEDQAREAKDIGVADGAFLDDSFYNSTVDFGIADAQTDAESHSPNISENRRLRFTYCISGYNGE